MESLLLPLLLVGALSGTTGAVHPLETSNPNSTYCKDFDDKCALVQEAALWGVRLSKLTVTSVN